VKPGLLGAKRLLELLQLPSMVMTCALARPDHVSSAA